MRESERAAYVQYVTERQTALRRTAYLLTGDRHRADDLVQDTITKVYVQWRRVSAADNVDAYVHTILVRTYADDRRSRWSAMQLFGDPPDGRATAPSDPGTRFALADALRQLAPKQRATLVLRFYCDFSVEQTARTLGCSTGTVKSQTSNALDALRRLIPTSLTWKAKP